MPRASPAFFSIFACRVHSAPFCLWTKSRKHRRRAPRIGLNSSSFSPRSNSFAGRQTCAGGSIRWRRSHSHRTAGRSLRRPALQPAQSRNRHCSRAQIHCRAAIHMPPSSGSPAKIMISPRSITTSHFPLLGRELATLTYGKAPEAAVPAGRIVLDDSIVPLVERAAELLGPSETTNALIAAYQPGRTFAQAFADFYSATVFAAPGLLINRRRWARLPSPRRTRSSSRH